MLVALTPLKMTTAHTSTHRLKKEYYDQLSKSNLLQLITDIMGSPQDFMTFPFYPFSSDHYASSMSQLFCDMIEKLSLDEFAESILQPLGASSSLLDTLISSSLSSLKNESIHTSSLRCICFIVKLSADPEVVVFSHAPTGGMLLPTSVPSVLHPMHDRMTGFIERRLPELIDAILAYPPSINDFQNGLTNGTVVEPVAHPGYKVSHPFGWRRILLLEVINRLVESKASGCAHFTPSFWKQLCGWIAEYPHNNMYHVLFYRIFFVVLKCVHLICFFLYRLKLYLTTHCFVTDKMTRVISGHCLYTPICSPFSPEASIPMRE